MKDNKLHTPEGVQDLLIDESAKKIEIQERIQSVFHRYGFYDIQSPTFEYYEVFSNERGNIDQKNMYKFFDRDGSILTLRPDMTPPMARIAATSYGNETGPLRFCYFGSTFRYNESYQGKNREFIQAGVELIGVNSVEADAEVIALAINSLSVSGLEKFQVDIGEVEFFKGILEEAGLDEETGEQLRSLIDHKDYIGLQEIVEQYDMDQGLKNLFLDLPKLFGSIEVVQRAKEMTNNKKALKALERLERVYGTLCDYGVEKYISFDLGMVNRLNYYTGIIFRGYTYGTGVSIIDGGRYDSLIGEFGKESPSVGFAVMIDQLLAAMERQQISLPIWNIDTLLIYSEKGRKQALRTADELRSEGMIIENSLLGTGMRENIEYAKRKKIGGILFFEDEENIQLINIDTEKKVSTTVTELLKNVRKENKI